MQIVAILLLSLVALVFSEFRIGGSTCNFDESGTCSANAGSAIIDITDGVSVDSDDECEAGEGSTRGVSYAFDVEEDGFYIFTVQGLGDDAALLVFEGEEANEDGCSAWLTIDSFWTGFTPAGSYVAVVTSNGGEADSCVNFTATATIVPYEIVGTTDMEIQHATSIASCEATLSTIWAGSFTFTPTDEEATHYSGFGQMISESENDVFSVVVAVFATEDLPEDMNDTTTMCAEYTDNSVQPESDKNNGYALEVGVEYTIFVSGLDTTTFEYVGGDFYFTFAQVFPEIEEEEIVCDEIAAEPKDYDRPSIPAVSVTDECELNEDEFVFDVVHTSYETDVFFVVDTLSCGDNSFDGAVVLYYGEQGTQAEGEDDAVAPTTCDNFVLAGDSGDGGAAYYWFPADETITVVPTTYNSGSNGGTYTLDMNTYDIVGCIPENPYLVAETDTGASVSLVVSFAIILVALF